MHIVIATASCRPDAHDKMVDVLTTLSTASRGDDGCESYNFYADVEDPNSFTSVEKWASADQAQAHMGTEHVAAAFAALPDLLAAPPVVTMHEVAESTPLG